MDVSYIDILDLRRDAKLGSDIGKIYDDIAGASSGLFMEFVGKLSRDQENCIDWWVSGAASRNQMLSPLFHYFISVRLVKQLLETGVRIGVVRVDSDGLTRILEGLKTHYIESRIEAFEKCIGSFKRIRTALSPFRTMLRCLGEWAAVRLSGASGVGRKPEGMVVLIDTFTIPQSVENDRYYPGLWEALTSRLKKKTWFVPEFHGFSPPGLYRAACKVRRLERNVILKESYLGLSDLWYAFGHYLRVRRLLPKDCIYEGVDFLPVIREELRDTQHFYSGIKALLNYRFPLRLIQAGVEVERAVDWCENHALDRGWNAGFGRYYPKVFRLGYQGFHVPSQSLCITEYEKQANITPDEIAVMGSGFVEGRCRFCRTLAIRVAPAFRYDHLWRINIGKRMPLTENLVIVALPIDRETSRFLVKSIASIAEEMRDTRFLIKSHPAVPLKLLGMKLRGHNLQETDRPLNQCLMEAKAAVCGGVTTAGLEALALGMPVIFAALPGRRTEVALPEGVPASMWRIGQNNSELTIAIKAFTSLDSEAWRKMRRAGEQVRKSYFEPVTEQGIVNFLEA